MARGAAFASTAPVTHHHSTDGSIMKNILAAALIAATLASAHDVAAQQPQLQAARAALTQCIAHAEAGDDSKKAEAKATYENAKKLFKAAVAAQPDNPDAHAGLGEAISRCGIPLANMM